MISLYHILLSYMIYFVGVLGMTMRIYMLQKEDLRFGGNGRLQEERCEQIMGLRCIGMSLIVIPDNMFVSKFILLTKFT